MSIFNFLKKKSGASVALETEQPEATPVQPTEKEAKKEEPRRIEGEKLIHNLIILDESGSMSSIYRPALAGLNETLQTIREAQNEHPEQKHRVTLVTFDTGHYNKIYDETPAADAPDLKDGQYRPNGGTPLYDAMGKSLNELRHHVKEEDIVLVTIITDGYENASREYNGKAIKAIVDSLKSEGWVFTYIGANQDVEAVAESMSINHCLAFEASQTGAQDMFEREKASRRKFYSKIHPDSRGRDLADDEYF